MERLEQSWLAEVRQSRIIILPGEASYLAEPGIRVTTVVEGLAKGLSEQDLMARYEGLTQADIRASGLFGYLRIIGKL